MSRLIAATALACLLIAGCSSSGGDSSAKATKTNKTNTPSIPGLKGSVNDHGTKTVSGGKVEVELDDDYIGPTFIKAAAGTKLTLELKNGGSKEHNFSLTGTKVNEDIEPGKSVSVDVTVPDTSTVYFCEYHQAKGMQGGFIVS
ncbi:MAG: cytochrome [Acidimicrobiales bacterium]|nr:cytochrome [Acidimicrobiales bacterium]